MLGDPTHVTVRNQMAGLPTPAPPLGGRTRKILNRVDPLKLQAHGPSPANMVQLLDKIRMILHAGDVHAGHFDYNTSTYTQIHDANTLNSASPRARRSHSRL